MTSAGVISRWSVVCLTCAFVVGCGPPAPPAGEVEINKLATWFQYYRTEHRGKAPKSEEELVAFIKKEYEVAPEKTPDMEQLLTSPRDGQRYVVMYGAKQKSRVDLEKNLACYEAEGVNGKRLVAYESAWTEELDQAALDAILDQYK